MKKEAIDGCSRRKQTPKTPEVSSYYHVIDAANLVKMVWDKRRNRCGLRKNGGFHPFFQKAATLFCQIFAKQINLTAGKRLMPCINNYFAGRLWKDACGIPPESSWRQADR